MNEYIKKAIIETYKKYGDIQAKKAISEAVLENDFNYFTNIDGARTQLKLNNGNQQEFKDAIFNQYIISVLNSPRAKNSLEQAIKETYKKYESREDVFYSIRGCLEDFLNGNNHFTRENSARENLNLEFSGLNQEELKKKILEIISGKIVSQAIKEEFFKVSNIKTYGENIQRAKQEMITGLTHDKEGSIYLANMQATTSIGKRRNNQEDAVLLKVHPKNPRFKILLVSDGMGGGIAGEEASNIVVTEINKWFDNIPEQYYENVERLQVLLETEIRKISELINSKHNGRSGATIVSAIIGKDNTLIANVGDSRAYAIKGTELKQVTEDQSLVQNLHKAGIIPQKDDMRFHKDSNKVFQILGSKNVNPQFTILKNNEYDKLLLFSDGVTDCLSDETIKIITQRTDRKKITEEIVKNAINNSSYLRPGLISDPNYNQVIPGGKDNTTAAMYERE